MVSLRTYIYDHFMMKPQTVKQYFASETTELGDNRMMRREVKVRTRRKKKGDKYYYEKVLNINVSIPLHENVSTYNVYRSDDRSIILVVSNTVSPDKLLKFIAEVIKDIKKHNKLA